jgi:hypothetical protein
MKVCLLYMTLLLGVVPQFAQANGDLSTLFGRMVRVNLDQTQELNNLFMAGYSDFSSDSVGQYTCDEYPTSKYQVYFTQAPELHIVQDSSQYFVRADRESMNLAWRNNYYSTLPQDTPLITKAEMKMNRSFGREKALFRHFDQDFFDMEPKGAYSYRFKNVRFVDEDRFLIRNANRRRYYQSYIAQNADFFVNDELSQGQALIESFLDCRKVD